ncbi:hypothetical protein ACE1SV_70080 [Streptomyces sp. E-15]
MPGSRTRTADDRAVRLAAKPGCTEAGRFDEYGAEQWFGARSPAMPPVEPGRPGVRRCPGTKGGTVRRTRNSAPYGVSGAPGRVLCTVVPARG